VSDYDVAAVRKQVGMDECGCLCCDPSSCCGELPGALAEIERLTTGINDAEWSGDAPTELGWYWWRQKPGDSLHPMFATRYSSGGEWWPVRIEEPV